MRKIGKLLSAALLIAASIPQMATASTSTQSESYQAPYQNVPIVIPNEQPSDPEQYAEWKSQFGKNLALNDPFNSFLGFVVGADGKYTMGTTGGDPENPNDDNRNILFGHPNPWSSYTTINIDGNTYIYSPNSEIPTDIGLGNFSSEITNNVKITQEVSIVHNTNTDRDDTVAVHYTMTNNDSSHHDVGLRIMMDTMLGYNDAAPFRIPGIGAVTTETELMGDEIPQYWQAFDSLINPTVASQGTFFGLNNEKPDKVQFTNWSRVYNNPWNYTVQTGSNNGDSAVSVYWNPKSLAPGESRDFVTYYGLSSFTQDLRPPLALSVTGDTSVSAINDKYYPNPFTVTAYIDNIGSGDANNVVATLNLPQGLRLVEGTNSAANLGKMSVGQNKMASWQVEIEPSPTEQDLRYSVTVAADNTETKIVSRTIHIPAISTDQNKTVIFIPGIMGTDLFTKNAHENHEACCGKDHDFENHKVWLPTKDDGLFAQHMIDHLAMNPDGSQKDELVVGQPVGEYYSNIIQQLGEAGYRVVPFGYDWRLSNKDNAQKLEDKINEVLAGKPHEKVNIVAHSMGGLVASKYIKNGNVDKVDKLITLGTPYLGSPKTAYIFGTGQIIDGIGGEIIDDNLLGVINNMPAPYQLFPSPLWFDLVGKGYINATWDYSWFKKTKHESLDSYSETKNLLKLWLNDRHINSAESFHESLDLLQSVAAMSNTYFIVGSNRPTIGAARIEMNQKGDDWKFGEIDDLEEINGDGTVPLLSANIGKQTPTNRTYYINEKHDELANNQHVIDEVMNILRGEPDKLEPKISRTPQNGKKLKLKVECPVELHVYDENHNHMGPNQNAIEEKIENGSYYLVGKNKDIKIAFLNNGDYSLIFKGTGKGKMIFTMQLYDEDDIIEKTIRFDDVKLTPETIMQAKIENDTIKTLSVDWNGDEVIDEQINPSVILDKEQSQDKNPPNLNLSLEGNMGKNGWYTSDVLLNMDATDAETGINKMEYTVNEGGQSQSYRDKVLFNEEGNYQVLGEVWDNNRNYAQQYVEFKIDKTKPSITHSNIDAEYYRGDQITFSYDGIDSGSGIESVTALLNGENISSGQKLTFNHEGVNLITIKAVDHAGNINVSTINVSVLVKVGVDFDPDVIVLPKSPSKNNAVITTFIQFPSDIKVDKLKIYNIWLNGVLKEESIKIDSEKNQLIVKFNRTAVSSLLQRGDHVKIQIDGIYNNDIHFRGLDYISVK